MNLEIKDPEKKNVFAKALKYLTQFTPNVSIRCGKEGDNDEDRFYIQGMDSAHVSLFELNLESSWFDSFEIGENAIVFSLDIKLLSGILCFRDKEQNIKMQLDDGDKLYIGLISENSIDKEFEIPLIDIDEERLNIPDVDYPADFIIDSKIFKDLIDQMGFFGKELVFNCDEENIKILSEGDNGKMKVDISFDDVDEYSIEEDKKLTLKFSLGYISWMMEYSNFIEKTHIYLSDNVPMQIYYSLGPSEKNYIRFYLAPMIDDY